MISLSTIIIIVIGAGIFLVVVLRLLSSFSGSIEEKIKAGEEAMKHYELGLEYYKTKMFEAAQEEFHKAIVLSPNIPIFREYERKASNMLEKTISTEIEKKKKRVEREKQLRQTVREEIKQNKERIVQLREDKRKSPDEKEDVVEEEEEEQKKKK